MLYDPKWDTKPTLAGFAAWLRTKDPQEEYNWSNPTECACGQYFGKPGWSRMPMAATISLIAMYEPRTFGALLDRVERAMSC